MTPFGERIRQLRNKRNISQKEMANALGVSPAYLSALEHGKRSAPSFDFVQRIIIYFNIIWDEADELVLLAGLSHPRVIIDTAGLSAKATHLANKLSHMITTLNADELSRISIVLDEAKNRNHSNY